MAALPHSRLQQSEIRLLTIEPEQSGKYLKLHLRTFPVLTCPPYIALSYEWGNENDGKSLVSVDGQDIAIRNNLCLFLLHLRLLRDKNDLVPDIDAPVYFWADAICINQADDVERAGQVEQMGSIFANAVHVVAWVWCAKDHFSSDVGDSGMEDATRSAEFLALPRWSSVATPEERFLRLEEQEHLITLSQLLVFPTYWTRSWIVQELVLAREVTLLFGVVRIQFKHVEAFFKAMSKTYQPDRARYRYYVQRDTVRRELETKVYDLGVIENEFKDCRAARLCDYRDRRRAWNTSPSVGQRLEKYFVGYSPGFLWHECLQHFHDFDCSEPPDVLYSLLAFIHTEDRLKPNYALPPIELIKTVYGIVRKRPWLGGLTRQPAFLLARFLARKLYRDLDAELSRLLGNATSLEHGASLGIKVEVKLRGFVDGHVSIQEAFRAGPYGDFSRKTDRLSPLRPLTYFEPHDLSGSLQDENEIDTREPAPPGQGEFEISDEMDLGLQDMLKEIADDVALWEQQERRKENFEHAKRLMDGGFWDQPLRGRDFSERQLTRRNDGAYSPIPGSAACRVRDENWDSNADNRYFVAYSRRSMFGRDKIYGISEFPIQRDDEIWQIPGVEMALIMRKDGRGYRLVSRAYLFENWNLSFLGIVRLVTKWEQLGKDEIDGDKMSWDCLSLDEYTFRGRYIELDLPLLLELSR